MNIVELCKDNYEYDSKIMYKTAFGYRNKYSNFMLYHFCSEECIEYFKKHSYCYKCNEDCTSYGKGTFENLGYTLCNGRCDMEPPCISTITSHKLEQRFTQEYIRHGYYKIDSDIIDKMLNGYDELKQIIANNGNTVSYNMLKDMYMFYSKFEVHERENDEETFYEYYNMIKDKNYYNVLYQ